MSYSATITTTVWLDVASHRVLDVSRTTVTMATARFSTATAALTEPVRTVTAAATAKAEAAATKAARHDAATTERRTLFQQLAASLLVAAAVAAVLMVAFGARLRRERVTVTARAAGVPDRAGAGTAGLPARR